MKSTALLIAVAALLAAAPASAQRFSLDGGPGPGAPPLVSPSIFMIAMPVDDTDVLVPGPAMLGPPGVLTTGVALGFPAPGFPSPLDELDALTYGGPVTAAAGTVQFSVDWLGVGVAGLAPDVFSEAGFAHAPADVFTGPTIGPMNAQLVNQAAYGLIPFIGPGMPFLGYYNDNIDALDLGSAAPGAGFPLFSVAAANTFGVSGADILMPGGAVATPAATLGLIGTDDIDGLHLDTGTGDIYFSLVPGSPSLGVAPNVACPAPAACSPGDVFIAPGGTGPFALAFAAVGLGLLAADNIDALAFIQPPPPPVPSLTLPWMPLLLVACVASAGLGLGVRRLT